MNISFAVSLLAMTSVSLHGKTIEIPDPMKFSNGQKVASVAEWQQKRRPEILENFRHQVYGRADWMA